MLVYRFSQVQSVKVAEIIESGYRRSLLQELLSRVRDAETGQRGFLLTGQVGYLKPYHSSIAALPDSIAGLRAAYFGQSLESQSRIKELLKLVDDVMEEFDATVALGANGSQTDALGIVQRNNGFLLMERIRDQVSFLVERESLLIEALEVERERNGVTIAVIGAVGASLSTGLMLASLVIFVRLIEASREAAAIMRKQALHDVLTGLPNRALFHDTLSFALRRSRRENSLAAILYIDLDGFKPINDRLGHSVGDEALRAFAEALNVTVRGSDLPARLGGDEFAVLLPKIEHRQDAAALGDRILDALDRIARTHAEWGGLAASIGVAIFPDNGGDADQMIKAADEAMYQAKRGGGRCVRFLAAMPTA